VERVVAAALSLLDEGGPQALSVRAVAGHLGVRPNTIYTYVPDRAALERAVVERILALADAQVLESRTGPWSRRVADYAARLRDVLLDHPGAATLFMTAPMDGRNALALGERLLGLLVDAGLPPEDASRAAYLLMVHVLGSVALEVAETDGTRPLPPEALRVAARYAALSHVPAGEYPLSAGTAQVAAAWVSREQFEWGLGVLLDGLAARVRPA
jgi:TetR/AcrR family transcriptional regulator, tetracycline repressor protein